MKKILFFLAVIFTFGKWTVLGVNIDYDTSNTKFENVLCNVIEENEDMKNAEEVETGELITGFLEENEDVDYYKFTVKRDTSVKIKFIGESFNLKCTILNNNGSILYNQKWEPVKGWEPAEGWEANAEENFLSAGTYYLQIESEHKGVYTFTINEGDYGITKSEIEIENMNDKYSYINSVDQIYLQENGQFKLNISFFDVIDNDISVNNEDISIDTSGFENGEIEIDNENLIISTNEVCEGQRRTEGNLIITINNYTKNISLVIQKGYFGVAKIKNENGDLYNGILMINKYIEPQLEDSIEESEIYTVNNGELMLPISHMYNDVNFYGIIAIPILEENIANSPFYNMRWCMYDSDLKEGVWDFGEIILQKPEITVYTYLEDGKTITTDANIRVSAYNKKYGNINFDLSSNEKGKFCVAPLGKSFYGDSGCRDLPRKVILKSYSNENNTNKVSNEELASFDTDKEIQLKYKKDQVMLNVLDSKGEYIEDGKQFVCEIEDVIDKSTFEVFTESENSVLKLSGFKKGHEYKINIKSLSSDKKEVQERGTLNFTYDVEIIRENIKLVYPIIRGKIFYDDTSSALSAQVNILNSEKECIYKTESDVNGYFSIYDLDLQGEYYVKVLPPKEKPKYSGEIIKKEINLDYEKNYVETIIKESSIYDLNRDGKINREDESYLFDKYLNSKRYEGNFDGRYDYNLDGIIDIYDIVRLCKNIMG